MAAKKRVKVWFSAKDEQLAKKYPSAVRRSGHGKYYVDAKIVGALAMQDRIKAKRKERVTTLHVDGCTITIEIQRRT